MYAHDCLPLKIAYCGHGSHRTTEADGLQFGNASCPAKSARVDVKLYGSSLMDYERFHGNVTVCRRCFLLLNSACQRTWCIF